MTLDLEEIKQRFENAERDDLAPSDMTDLIAEVERLRKELAKMTGALSYQDWVEQETDRQQKLIMASLRRFAGSAMWLDGLTDEDWKVLWTEIMPWVLKEANQRGEFNMPIWVAPSRCLATILHQPGSNFFGER